MIAARRHLRRTASVPLLALLAVAVAAAACAGNSDLPADSQDPEQRTQSDPSSVDETGGDDGPEDAQEAERAGAADQAATSQTDTPTPRPAEGEADADGASPTRPVETDATEQASEPEADDAGDAAEAGPGGVTAPAPPGPNQPLAAELTLPPGFRAYRWAEDFFQPTVIRFSPDGTLFVAERFGQVWNAADRDGDGRAEDRVLFADGFAEPVTGLLVLDARTVLVSDASSIVRLVDEDGDRVADLREALVSDLPFGLHHSNGMAMGPDGRLYFGVGSTCNECAEADPRSATIQALDLTSGALETIATGLRNPYALVFTPDGTLWATDNGSDPPCATPDELNRIRLGAHYGWPYCAAEDRFTVAEAPAIEFGLHPSADGFAWVEDAAYPAAWSNGFYVALFGTGAAGAPQTGKVVTFVRLDASGTLSLQAFGSGFGNPLDLILGPDGALWVADFGAGVIYRILPPE